MVKVFAELFPENEGYYLDGTLLKNLEKRKKIVKTSDTHHICIVFGDVGSGKSTLAAQIAFFYDQTFNHNRMCQSEKQFREQLEQIQKHQAIVLDEAFESLNSTEAARRAQLLLVNLLQVIRQQNLFIIVVLPSIFSLNKTVAISASDWCLRTYMNKKGQRGFFQIWGKDNKRQLYILGKRLFDHRASKPNFSGRFTKFMPIDEAAYKQMKANNLQRMLAEEEAKVKTKIVIKDRKFERDEVIKSLFAEGKNVKDIARLMNLAEVSVYKILEGER